MGLTIEEIRDATDVEWDNAWRSCEVSTYYHSRDWAEIWERYTNHHIQPAPKLITFSDGVSVLLPFSRQKYFGGVIYRYSLTGPPAMALPYYGNWLTSASLSARHISLLSELILHRYPNTAWRLNPYDENSKRISVLSKYAVRRPLVTYVIDLTKGEDAILSSMKQSCRNQIRQALRNNLRVSEGTGVAEWRVYYGIYMDTVKRWGAKTIYKLDWKIFETLSRKRSPHIKLWLVWHDDVAIAGGICVYSHGKIITWHISSLTEYHKLRPVNMFKYMMIKEGIHQSYHWLDFETAGRNKGLQEFKKSFGADEKMCDVITTWHPVVYLARKYLR